MTLEELIRILQVHEQKLAQDEGIKKGKSLVLMIQRPKCNSVSKESSSKVFVVNDALEEEFEDDDSNEEDDELSLITRKIRKMWRNKKSSKFNGSSKRSFHKKEKSPIICCECNKSGQFKLECLDLEKRLKGREVLKELPPEILKHYEEIETSKDKLGKFVGIHEALNKIIKVQRNLKDKSSHGFKGKKIVHGEEVTIFYLCGKVCHETHKCNDLSEKGNPSRVPSNAYQHPHANKEKRPKRIWVPKSKIIPVADLLDRKKETPVMVPEQRLLTTYDRQKVHVPIPKPYVWCGGHFQRE
ncbi:hypothetical protein HKD37_20G056466 [Glycine soja]